MFRVLTATFAALCLLSWSRPGAAETPLTLDQALDLARERGLAAIAARGRVDEARGRRAGAAALLADNPEVEVLAGSRAGSGSLTHLELGVGQSLELGGRRGARIRGADAAIAREAATADDSLRVLSRDVKVAFYRALHADERLALARSAAGVAGQLLGTTRRRHQAGELSELDLNLARAAAARAEAEAHRAEAARARAIGDLSALVGLGPGADVRPRGDLKAVREHARDRLLSRAAGRPDVAALAAEQREADAEIALGRGLGWPEIGARVEYHREDDEDILLGGLTLRLPAFARGQELRHAGRARKARATAHEAALRAAIAVEVEAAFAVRARLSDAARAYERGVLAALDDNEALARKSFEAGRMGVADYLVIRREILDGRRGYLDQLLELAIASAELEASAGVL